MPAGLRLADALRARPGDVIAFTGAGGKTSALLRLAAELDARGLRVLTTTTTRMALTEAGQPPLALALGDPPVLPPDLAQALEQKRHVFLYSRQEPPGKVRGFDAAWVDAHLAAYPGADVLLVEADGARRLPLKAPHAHEPPIPAAATCVVPTAGLSVLGQPLDEAHVYNAAAIIAHTGAPPGSAVTPALIASVLGASALGLKNVPPGARVAPLLNQATAGVLPAAREAAARLASVPRIEQVLIGAVSGDPPVWERHRPVAAVVLAAGQSTRMGQPKLLLPWGGAGTILRAAVQRVLAAGLGDVVVVTGEHHDALTQALAGLPVSLVNNPRYAEGEMLSSLQAGLRALAASQAAACLVVLGDQPALEASVLGTLLGAYAQGAGEIVVPVYEGRRGHPVLFDRAQWAGLLALPPGSAPRHLLRARPDAVAEVPVASASVVEDIDTPEDYRRARRA